MTDEPQGTEVVKREDVGDLEVQEGRFDLADVDDPTQAIQKAETLIGAMAERCNGPKYIAQIQGKDYPKVEWWTTVGASLGLFPQEEACRKLDRDGETAYEATVGVYRGDQRVTRASAICSSAERTWSGRDEYAIRSMAVTRATGKAYRVGLSFLAVMADLEPTPAEEMPNSGSRSQESDTDLDCPDCGGPVWDNRDDEKAALNGGKRPNFKCKDRDGCNWASWDSEDDVWGADIPDEIDAALNELSGLNADRSAEARAWVEGLASDLYDDPEKTASVLSTIEQAVAEEKSNGGAPSGESEAEGAPSDVPGEPAAKAEVRKRLKQEVGEAWKGQLSEFGFQMEGFSANTDEWSEQEWAEVLEGLERHGMAYIQAPDEVLSGEGAS